MTWITVLWPMAIGACVTMGLIQLRVGLRRTPGSAPLLFALNAFVVAVYAGCELALAVADSPAQYLAWLRWLDIMAALQVVTTSAFVWSFFGTGRKWLALLAAGLSCLAVTADLLPQPKLVYLHLTGIRKLPTFGGATYTVADGVENPWNAVFYLGVLLLVVFVADASVTLWRRGARRRASVVGGTITFFVLAGGTQAALVDTGILRTPYLLSFAYLAILVAMGMELSEDALRAAKLASDLLESEQRMSLAVDAAQLGLWIGDIPTQRVWTSEQCNRLFGYPPNIVLSLADLRARVHPEDRALRERAIEQALAGTNQCDTEYRVQLPDGTVRWLTSVGRMERGVSGKPTRILGVVADITGRRRAEAEARELGGRLISAQEAERRRIARDLHDDLSQRLALLSVELELLGQKPPAEREAVAERMEEFSGVVKHLSSDVHRLAHELHPAKLDQLGLVAAARGFCRELAATHEIAITFESKETLRELPKEVALCLYRITQEALQNVIKHSGATSAQVELGVDANNLQLRVTDDGQGFDSSAMPVNGALGIVSMRERVRMVQGELTIHSRPGAGAQIEVRVPIATRASGAER
ncbi:MAG: PAS domain-containing protein [Verrucomicrobia bacterium]|nr:PAS domain-containing protein [Verrucomicrobiota bacterium]